MLVKGYEIIENCLTESELDELIASLCPSIRPSQSGGIRNIEKKVPRIGLYVKSSALLAAARLYLPAEPKLVRAILFDKTAEDNWLVPWHQDRTVAVSTRFEAPNWHSWSIKDGVHHAQPPLNVLNQMVTFRINLDSSTLHNGCLKVIPHSHNLGLLSQQQIESIVKDGNIELCECGEGSVVVMRPHLLHSSSKALRPIQRSNVTTHRRVLHLEFSSFILPEGISWS